MGCAEFDSSLLSNDIPDDAGVDASDGATEDGTIQSPSDASTDSGTNDASQDAATDGSNSDSDTPPPAECAIAIDSSTISLYRFTDFAGITVKDAAENYDGTLQQALPTVASAPDQCGQALNYSNADGFMEIPDAPDWQLQSGSLDFYVYLPAELPTGNAQGIISRDASGQTLSGHFFISWDRNGLLAIRIQDTQDSWYICSNGPVPRERWMHVGMNIGAPEVELYIEGQKMNGTGSFYRTGSISHACSTGPALGIDGNNNPWVIGANTNSTPEGSAVPAEGYFHGRISALRISSTRRDFAAMLQ